MFFSFHSFQTRSLDFNLKPERPLQSRIKFGKNHLLAGKEKGCPGLLAGFLEWKSGLPWGGRTVQPQGQTAGASDLQPREVIHCSGESLCILWVWGTFWNDYSWRSPTSRNIHKCDSGSEYRHIIQFLFQPLSEQSPYITSRVSVLTATEPCGRACTSLDLKGLKEGRSRRHVLGMVATSNAGFCFLQIFFWGRIPVNERTVRKPPVTTYPTYQQAPTGTNVFWRETPWM